MKNACFVGLKSAPIGRKTARDSAKPTGFCNRLIILCISAGTGPEECAYTASRTLQALLKEADGFAKQGKRITADVLETEPARIKGNIRSALVLLAGKDAPEFAASWTGSIQWVWQSTYRPHHKRKNWFVQVTESAVPETGGHFSLADIRFETARADGPGGQYTNKTETAVRAVHIPSGKSALARDERSQGTNKKAALARLALLFEKEAEARESGRRSRLRHGHYELVRGNPVRVFDTGLVQ